MLLSFTTRTSNSVMSVKLEENWSRWMVPPRRSPLVCARAERSSLRKTDAPDRHANVCTLADLRTSPPLEETEAPISRRAKIGCRAALSSAWAPTATRATGKVTSLAAGTEEAVRPARSGVASKDLPACCRPRTRAKDEFVDMGAGHPLQFCAKVPGFFAPCRIVPSSVKVVCPARRKLLFCGCVRFVDKQHLRNLALSFSRVVVVAVVVFGARRLSPHTKARRKARI